MFHTKIGVAHPRRVTLVTYLRETTTAMALARLASSSFTQLKSGFLVDGLACFEHTEDSL